MNTIANALRQATDLPGLPADYVQLLEMIATAAEAERDDSDPMQLRRDLHLIVGIMQRRYGDQAIPMAEQIAKRLGNMPFARVVISSLKRREREAQRASSKSA
ncbi:hypothetical protein NGM99_10825 [Mesorhizobium sp. RP14(2022)]|uniref:Uncharacterized protein n=1 Tax=Mesorhizobium liriopis TaxID=2953882 RepID=A0ABT1C623_9HYPH|nr:hypothetical protein [Mesorhizobium liriopis]MCO6050277.1 hypothetical protein [Mesorhizobium liriopis]